MAKVVSKKSANKARKSSTVEETRDDREEDTVAGRETREKDYGSFTNPDNKVFIEQIIKVIFSCKGISKLISSDQMLRLIFLARRTFSTQSRLLEVDAPVRICGDTHGQFGDLIRLFDKGGFPPKTNYLFLGDYVDRGRHGLEVILLLLCYKVRYPKNFFLLRGNHECAHINTAYGFRDEIIHRKPQNAAAIYEEFRLMFNMMPLSAIVGDRILCMHGGLSPRLTSLDDLRNVVVPTDAATDSLEMDLLWADPMSGQPNLRGASVSFGEDVVQNICKTLDIDLVVRAHQVVQDGFEFFASRKLVTIFSAPHYCGQFDNSGAMCVVSEGLEVSFEVLRPAPIELHVTASSEKAR